VEAGLFGEKAGRRSHLIPAKSCKVETRRPGNGPWNQDGGTGGAGGGILGVREGMEGRFLRGWLAEDGEGVGVRRLKDDRTQGERG